MNLFKSEFVEVKRVKDGRLTSFEVYVLGKPIFGQLVRPSAPESALREMNMFAKGAHKALTLERGGTVRWGGDDRTIGF